MTSTSGPDGSDATITGPALEQPGQVIGRYTLLEQIGEGGFGTVWAAEQREPVTRRVALKIIKLGMDTREVIARFEAERQALAMMDHPNIAKVLDAGSTDTGRPYFVMELVKGESITSYCDRESLSTRDRLRLFIATCQAVQHAHQKGIIHRDIKPSNVLVTLSDGVPVPRVIDFGIAKATSARLTEQTIFTQRGQLIGTPEYMSPEQAQMSELDIDTRSDVYSLGVLLYELLTGTTPFSSMFLRRAGLAEIQRIIREDDPPRPSTRVSSLASARAAPASAHAPTIAQGPATPAGDVDTGGQSLDEISRKRRTDPKTLSRSLRGDLDWIIMKALEKNRTRRYETAAGFANDIERYLSDEPVQASPPSRSYRMRKFVRRNRAGVVAASLVAVALVLGIAGTTWGMLWALTEKDRADEQTTLAKAAASAEAKQRDIADARADELELVAAFQAEQLSAIEPEAMGANLRRSLIDAAPEADRDALAAALAPINFTSLALTTLQDNIFERTIGAIDTQFQSQPLVRARLLQTVADTLRDLGLLDLATDPQHRALDIRREHLGDDHPDTLTSINNMGLLLQVQGKLAEAEPYCRDALVGQRRVLGDDHPFTLISINNMGTLLKAKGKLTEAEPYFREALDGSRRVLGDDHPSTLKRLNNMGALLQAQGKLAEAEPYFREALDGSRRVLGDDHTDTLTSIGFMGSLLQAQGRLAEAEPYFREALDGRRRVLGDDHPRTLTSISNMGTLLNAQGKLAEAEPYCREVLVGQRRVLGDDHPFTLISISSMGYLLKAQGKLAEAEPYFREALDGSRRVLGDDHPSTLISINNMGDLLRAQGRLAEAEPYFREALDGSRRVLGDDHPDTLNCINNMGYLLKAQGKLALAEPYYRQALEGQRRVLGDDHPRTLTSISNMGTLLNAQGKLAEAEPYLRESLDGRRSVLGDDHPSTLISMLSLGRLLRSMGRLDEADALGEEAVHVGRDALGDEDWNVGVILGQHARTLAAMGRYADAQTRALEAYAVLSAALGEDHDGTQGAVNALIDLYTAWHEAEPDAGHDTSAAQWRAKLENAPPSNPPDS